MAIHDKVALSRLDREHFEPGYGAAVVQVEGLIFGVQACRELLFPEVWSKLKSDGAKIIFHINNAVQKHDALWENILIARAIESGIFVCSVNNALPPQMLTSYLISPSGEILRKADTQVEESMSAEIDLTLVIEDLGSRTDY